MEDNCELERELLSIAEDYRDYHQERWEQAEKTLDEWTDQVPLQCQSVGVPKPTDFGEQEVDYAFDPRGVITDDPQEAAERCHDAVQQFFDYRREANNAFGEVLKGERLVEMYRAMLEECEHQHKHES